MVRRSLRTDSIARTEQLTVQLEEAKALIERGTTSHARLAFILLDNAAEILMFRNLEVLLVSNDLFRQIKAAWDKIIENISDPQVRVRRDEVARKIVSSKKLKELRYNFNAKVEFLQEHDSIQATVAQVLKTLHRYRNEAYHQDTVRIATVQSASLLYFDVVCILFENLKQFIVTETVREPPPALAKYGSSEAAWGMPTYEMITSQLRAGLGLNSVSLKDVLITNLTSRLDKIEADLRYAQNILFGIIA